MAGNITEYFEQSDYPHLTAEFSPSNERLFGGIRLSIFLITAVCADVPALVWVLRVLYRHQKSGGRISALVMILLLSNVLQLLLSLFLVSQQFQDKEEGECWLRSVTCHIFFSLWSGSNLFGLHLQQVLVLEAALHFRHPDCSAHVFFTPCSIIISIIVFLFFFICVFLVLTLVLLALPLLLVTNLISWIVTCRAPPHIGTRKPSSAALAFVTFTMVLYVTFVFVFIFTGICWYYRLMWCHWVVMGLCLMSLRLPFDPLLCVLVYRKDLRLHKTPQSNMEAHTGIELTLTHTVQEI